MPRARWITWDDVPEKAQPMLAAYDQVVGLRFGGAVVRYISDIHPLVYIQHRGRLTAGTIRAIEEAARCRVEVEARGPGYLLIVLFGELPMSELPPKPENPTPCSSTFLYKPDTL